MAFGFNTMQNLGRGDSRANCPTLVNGAGAQFASRVVS
jgi:hypothetical protein